MSFFWGGGLELPSDGSEYCFFMMLFFNMKNCKYRNEFLNVHRTVSELLCDTSPVEIGSQQKKLWPYGPNGSRVSDLVTFSFTKADDGKSEWDSCAHRDSSYAKKTSKNNAFHDAEQEAKIALIWSCKGSNLIMLSFNIIRIVLISFGPFKFDQAMF